MEYCYADTSKTEDIEKSLEEAERTHAAKLTVLEQKLREETEKRWGRFAQMQCADDLIKRSLGWESQYYGHMIAFQVLSYMYKYVQIYNARQMGALKAIS